MDDEYNQEDNKKTDTPLFILRKLEPDHPFIMYGHRLVGNADNIFCYGGTIIPNVRLTNCHYQLWKYNMATNFWKVLKVIGDVPDFLKCTMAYHKGKLVIYSNKNIFYINNLKEETLCCSIIDSTGITPDPVDCQESFVRDGHFYTVGGKYCYLGKFMNIYKFNLKTHNWQNVYTHKEFVNSPWLNPRNKISILDNKMFIVGGNCDIENYFIDIRYFDLKSNTWSTVQSIGDEAAGYPKNRYLHSVVCVPFVESFFIFGGLSSDGVLDCVWRFHVPSLRWKKLEYCGLICPVYWHDTYVTPFGKMYTYGGRYFIPSASPLVGSLRLVRRSVEGGVNGIFTLTTFQAMMQIAWLCFPTLEQLAWEKLTSVYQQEILKQILPYLYKIKLE